MEIYISLDRAFQALSESIQLSAIRCMRILKKFKNRKRAPFLSDKNVWTLICFVFICQQILITTNKKQSNID
jgi:hypothetical protein